MRAGIGQAVIRGLLPLALALLVALPAAAEAVAFRSNAFGMQLEPLASYRRDEYRFTLEVSKTPGRETRRLFDKGKETRRWEVSDLTAGGTEERELADGALTARRVSDASGNLLQEDVYTKGAVTQRSQYIYASSRLSRLIVTTGDGKPLYTQEYFYTLRGALREVRRLETGGAVRDASFVSGSSGLSEERNGFGDLTYISRYDLQGRLCEEERRDKNGPVSAEEFTYAEASDHLVSSTEKEASGTITHRGYDTDGKLVTETVSSSKKTTDEITYTRDEKGRVISKERRSPSGLEQWKYTLDDAGKTTREEYLRRGSLSKVTLYGEDSARTEEMYENGNLFLKAYFKGDTRTREEVYSEGKLVRTRSFE